ncbi:IclR family transcriptional regulator domain-containing protein [Halobellus sp. GM3]|uniref:IclR family transcriptional regulator domain-containing protein n=1 Tax=Halobellus sp. GM3 TaxID=3458410 RepID=UPI00403DD95A
MDETGLPKQWSKTTQTAFEVIESIEEQGETTVTELADSVGLAASTVHNHLGALQRLGYVIKEDGKYRLSLRFLTTGMSVRNQSPLIRVAQPVIDDVARETGEAAWVATLEDGFVYFICNARGENAIQAYGDLGARRLPHAIAAGKAILAHLPVEAVRGILAKNGLPAYTDRTITSRSELFEALERTRERGFALNRGEHLDGGNAIASPVLLDGSPVGSIGISGPAHRFRGDRLTEELPQSVTGARNEIELQLSSPL